tara:strand:- start:12 stop:206 length:195 start_codon:yes stop_codon:yes gene_type:complete
MKNKKDRQIPAATFRKYGKLFAEGVIKDEYAVELSALLFLMAADVEFHNELEKDWDDWYEGPIH